MKGKRIVRCTSKVNSSYEFDAKLIMRSFKSVVVEVCDNVTANLNPAMWIIEQIGHEEDLCQQR